MSYVHVNAAGTVIRITVKEGTAPLDISTATGLTLYLRKPDTDQTILERDAMLTTDGTDGKLEYTTVSDDLDTPGMWRVQAELVFSNGRQWRTSVADFDVLPNL